MAIVFNEGLNGTKIPVPVLKPGEFPKTVRVAEVQMPSGAIAIFGGDLLKEAISIGAIVLKEIQKGQ